MNSLYVIIRGRFQFSSAFVQMAVISLVIVEACLVVVELMVEAEGGAASLSEGLHVAALFLLSVFLLELCVKITVIRMQFLQSWVKIASVERVQIRSMYNNNNMLNLLPSSWRVAMSSQITQAQLSNIHSSAHILSTCALTSVVVPFLQFTQEPRGIGWLILNYLHVHQGSPLFPIFHVLSASTVTPLLPKATFSPFIQPNLVLPRARLLYLKTGGAWLCNYYGYAFCLLGLISW